MDEQSYQLALTLRTRLQAELSQNDTYKALQHVEAIIAMSGQARTAPEPPLELEEALKRPSLTRHLAGSNTSRIVTATENYLRRKGTRAVSGEILRELSSLGITVGGKAPVKALSSCLSHSVRFDNVPGQGYGLQEWSEGTQIAKPLSSGFPYGETAGAVVETTPAATRFNDHDGGADDPNIA
jgi:hypothetical protein